MGIYGCDNIDSRQKINLRKLKEWGYLTEGTTSYNLTFSWEKEWGEENRIYTDISVGQGTGSMRLYYTSTDRTGEKHQMDYTVGLASVTCRYGGRKWFFICPNQSCNRRSRFLYSYGRYYVCRKCTGLWYDSQTHTCNRYRSLDHVLKAERMMPIKRRYYRGKHTRRYKRFLKLTGGRDGVEFAHYSAELTNRLLMC